MVKDNVISELQIKRQELVALAQTANEDISHIDYAIKALSKNRANGHLTDRSTKKNGLTAKQVIVEILKESDTPLARKEILESINSKGFKFSEGTFDVSLSKLLNSKKPSIQKVERGVYKSA